MAMIPYLSLRGKRLLRIPRSRPQWVDQRTLIAASYGVVTADRNSTTFVTKKAIAARRQRFVERCFRGLTDPVVERPASRDPESAPVEPAAAALAIDASFEVSTK
jgi:hypothetical protein